MQLPPKDSKWWIFTKKDSKWSREITWCSLLEDVRRTLVRLGPSLNESVGSRRLRSVEVAQSPQHIPGTIVVCM